MEQAIKKVGKEVKESVVGYITAAFGLVAGLAWNEAIKSFIEFLFPLSKNTLLAKFVYAGILTLICTITGKVQMVMFRDFIQRKARALNISGTVENGEDGSVRVVAQGDEKSLQTFIEYLHKGPFLARVARVGISWKEPVIPLSGFKIIY